jgi:hypothetical protein
MIDDEYLGNCFDDLVIVITKMTEEQKEMNRYLKEISESFKQLIQCEQTLVKHCLGEKNSHE